MAQSGNEVADRACAAKRTGRALGAGGARRRRGRHARRGHQISTNP